MDYFLKLDVTFEMEIMMNCGTYSLLCFIKLVRDDASSEVKAAKKKKKQHRSLLFLTINVYIVNEITLFCWLHSIATPSRDTELFHCSCVFSVIRTQTMLQNFKGINNFKTFVPCCHCLILGSFWQGIHMPRSFSYFYNVKCRGIWICSGREGLAECISTEITM